MAKEKWEVSKEHSSIGFTVKHMKISKVSGTFNEYDANVEVDPNDLTDAHIEFDIDARSVDTHDQGRDDHLRADDFFATEKYPHMTFTTTDVMKKEKNHYDLTGDFTIKEITLPVTFDVVFEGTAKDPMSGQEAAGFTAKTTINRKDFGLTWNAAIEAGGVVVSEDVKINLEIQLRK